MRRMIHAAALATLSLFADVGAATFGEYQPLSGQVVDANGRVIGPYVYGPTVLMAFDGLPVAINLRAANVVGKDGTAHRDPTRLIPRTSGSGEGVYFAEPDCTGAAYVVSNAEDGDGTLPGHVIADGEGGGTLYLGRRRETMQPLLNSLLKDSSYPPQCINYPRPTHVFIPMVPTRAVIDLSTLFKPPYRIR
jgi:hypothetical protein